MRFAEQKTEVCLDIMDIGHAMAGNATAGALIEAFNDEIGGDARLWLAGQCAWIEWI